MNNKHRAHLIVIGTALIAVILLVVVTSYLPELRSSDLSKAAVSAKLALPTAITVTENNQFNLPVSLDTAGNTVIGIDLILQYSAQSLALLDIQPNTATTFKTWLPQTGASFDKSRVISNAQSSGQIKLSGLAADINGNKRPGFLGQLTSQNPLLTLVFRANSVTSNQNTQVTLANSLGNTVDSNITIAEAENDSLLSAQNAAITITDSTTTVPSTNPTVSPTTTPTQAPPTANPTTLPTVKPTVIPTAVATLVPQNPGNNSIVVYATGTVAGGIYPQMRLWADGIQVSGDIDVNKSSSSSTFQPYTAVSSIPKPAKVRVYFVNDAVISSPYQDRNLRVQKIVVHGVEYLSTAADVYSVGICNSSGCGAGFKRSEWLAAGWWTKNPPLWNTGYFEYSIR